MYKNINNFNILIALVISLFFFPSITFGTLQAEVFPWGLIIATLIIFYQRRINIYFIFVLIMLVANILFFSVLNLFDIKITEIIRSLFAYTNSLLSFVAFLQLSEKSTLKGIKLVKGIFIFLISLGILQYLRFLVPFDAFFKFLIPRASSTSLSFMNRGVTLLSTEPARAGISLIFIYIVVRTVFIKPKKQVYFDIGFFVFLGIIIQAFMPLSLYFVYMLLVYRIKLIKYLLIGGGVLLFTGAITSGGRSVDLIKNLMKQNNFDEMVFLLVNNSGHRLLSIYSSWRYALTHPFGGGIGNWEVSSVEALKETGYNVSKLRYFIIHGEGKVIPIRSSGFVSNLVLDVGFIGFIVFVVFLYFTIRKFWDNSIDSKNIILIFLFKIFIIGSVGTPVAWVAAILALKYIKYKNNFINEKQHEYVS